MSTQTSNKKKKKTVKKTKGIDDYIKSLDKAANTSINLSDKYIETKNKTSKVLKKSFGSKDISFLFSLLAFTTLIIMVIKFIAYLFHGISIDVDLSKFGNTLNTAIIMIGCGEGIRSFTKTVTEHVGESSPVPAYKIKFLLRYLLIFIVLTGIAIAMEYYVTLNINSEASISPPSFAGQEMSDGMLSNIMSYLVARYGNKIAENIDLSNLSFFKKK